MIAPLRDTETPPGPPAEIDDSLLVRRLRRGEADAFEALYRRLVGRIYGLALRLSGRAAEAEELTQEAFVRAWERRDAFASGEHMHHWLRRVTVNLWINSLRRAKRWPAEPAEAADARQTPQRGRGMPPAALRLDLERALAELPERIRAVCVLFDVYGLRHQEIAVLLGITVTTSKIHLHRARRRLREGLQ